MTQTYLHLSEPRSFPWRQLLSLPTLGVPLAIWAAAILLITVAAHFDTQIVAFEAQELLAPF